MSKCRPFHQTYLAESSALKFACDLVDPATIVTSSASDIASLDDLIAKVLKEPTTVSVANFKSLQTLALAQLRDATAIQVEIIRYSGFKGASVNVMGDYIDAAVGNFSASSNRKTKMHLGSEAGRRGLDR